MKAKAYTTYILEIVKDIRSKSGAKNLLGALTSCELVNGRKELRPAPTAWIIYTMFGCPSTNFATALMWVKDRRDETRQDALKINEEKDTVIYALRQFLGNPKAIDDLKVLFFFFSHDGRLTIIRENQTDILPKKIMLESGKVQDTLQLHLSEEAPGAGILIPAKIMQKLVKKSAFTAKDLEEERKKVYA